MVPVCPDRLDPYLGGAGGGNSEALGNLVKYFTEVFSNSIFWISVVSVGSYVSQGKDKVTTRFKYSITTNYNWFVEWKTASTASGAAPYNQCVPLPWGSWWNCIPGSPINSINKPEPGYQVLCVLITVTKKRTGSLREERTSQQRKPSLHPLSPASHACSNYAWFHLLHFLKSCRVLLFIFNLKIIFLFVCLMHTRMPQCKHGDHRATYGSQVLPAITWILRTKLKS